MLNDIIFCCFTSVMGLINMDADEKLLKGLTAYWKKTFLVNLFPLIGPGTSQHFSTATFSCEIPDLLNMIPRINSYSNLSNLVPGVLLQYTWVVQVDLSLWNREQRHIRLR